MSLNFMSTGGNGTLPLADDFFSGSEQRRPRTHQARVAESVAKTQTDHGGSDLHGSDTSTIVVVLHHLPIIFRKVGWYWG